MQKTILLIEDESTIGALIEAKLLSSGYLVKWAKDGLEGWQQLQQEKPDLVLLDVRMPKMSGLQVLQAIRVRQNLRDLPVMIISNSATDAEVRELMKLGVSDYLIKLELEPDELVEKLGKYFKVIEDGDGVKKIAPSPEDKVLVVEDEPVLSEVLAKKLQNEGFIVLTAPDAKSGLALIEKEKPRCVLLDLVLPGMNGYEMLQRLRQNPETKDLPVIIITNFADPEHIKMVEPYNVAAYIAKADFSPDAIIEKVENVLGKGGQQST